MRRLARHLFTVCSAASLLLCVEALPVPDNPVLRGHAGHVVLPLPCLGHVDWELRSCSEPTDRPPVGVMYEVEPLGPNETMDASYIGDRHCAGFNVWAGPWMTTATPVEAAEFYNTAGLRTPFCLYPIAATMLPTIWLTKMMRDRRRFRCARCGKCGYDLRASLECCPECGTSTASTAV